MECYVDGGKSSSQSREVLYVQPFIPGDNGQPFVIIIQDWMLEMCRSLSTNNAWAIDSTFRTNQFGLPLYAAVAPNSQGVGIPLWYMMCTNVAGSGQEKMALQLTLRKVFGRIANVRPSAIVIDKSWLEYNAIKAVIEEDPSSWKIENGIRIQTHCKILLCWFHVKKAWVS